MKRFTDVDEFSCRRQARDRSGREQTEWQCTAGQRRWGNRFGWRVMALCEHMACPSRSSFGHFLHSRVGVDSLSLRRNDPTQEPRGAGYRLASRKCLPDKSGRTVGDKAEELHAFRQISFRGGTRCRGARSVAGRRQGLQDRLLGLLGHQSVPGDDGQRRQEGRRGMEGKGRQRRHDRHQRRRQRQGQAGFRSRGPQRTGRRRRPDFPRRQRAGRRADQDHLQRRRTFRSSSPISASGRANTSA